MEQTHTNRLFNEASPYLQQHAHNPVDWWPWCEEALTQAKEQDKPILLSIGYSACHWCHVMAHESFEDKKTAQAMNDLFINIKVDREERPDLDKIYQSAHQLLNQRPGGWPLTMILSPDDQTPFFAGTYFPVTAKHQMPAFREILGRVNEFYKENGSDIREQSQSLINALAGIDPNIDQETAANTQLNGAPIDQARQQLEQHYDKIRGGFGNAPKFPHPTNLERLLRHWSATREYGNEDTRALQMVNKTLLAMAQGGIYDQLGGGFYRYSVDDDWMIPHFEKMLYDNGPLLTLYSEVYAVTKNETYQRTINETALWVMREMQSGEGGYYSTLDADSEGEEGRFYVWTPEQVKSLINDDEYAVFNQVYGLDRDANFEDQWHLHTFEDLEKVASKLCVSNQKARKRLNNARKILLAEREKRIYPGRDEKILTSWNGLMIKGMASAGRHLDDLEYITSAQKAIDFIEENLFVNGRLLATYKDGQARLMAYLDDYAFMLDALLEMLQAQWRDSDIIFAIRLADALLQHFEDTQHGGFYFTAHDHETLIHRPKPVMDEAIPAGNAIATYALTRLGHLLGEQKYLDAAHHTIQAAWPTISHAPYASAAFLHGLEEHLYPPDIYVLRGRPKEMKLWQQQIEKRFSSRRMIFCTPDSEKNLPGLLAQRQAADTGTVAYHCSGTQCYPPITHIDELESYDTHRK